MLVRLTTAIEPTRTIGEPSLVSVPSVIEGAAQKILSKGLDEHTYMRKRRGLLVQSFGPEQ